MRPLPLQARLLRGRPADELRRARTGCPRSTRHLSRARG